MESPLSFEFARDTVTQLITLATGIIGVSVTFAKDVGGGMKPVNRSGLYRSWRFFLLSILFGVWALLALTGTVSKEGVASADIYGKNIVLPTALQIFAFLAGIFTLIRQARS
jgi:hypothetical protein